MLPSSTLKLSASALALSRLYQHFRERDFPYGLQDSLCTLAPYCCSRVTPLRNGTNTRYGRVASPYPTGTYTPQETPSFARRDNVKAKAARAPNDAKNQHDARGARSLLSPKLGHFLSSLLPGHGIQGETVVCPLLPLPIAPYCPYIFSCTLLLGIGGYAHLRSTHKRYHSPGSRPPPSCLSSLINAHCLAFRSSVASAHSAGSLLLRTFSFQ
jgi:hypothetical protein